jgi:hypothetical protein
MVFALSCRKISDTQAPFTSVSYPLAVGNWWQYQLTSIGSYPDTFTLSIDSTVTIGPYTKYICNYVGNGSIIPAGYFLESDTSLVFTNTSRYADFSPIPNFHLKFPAFVGQHWSGAYPPQDSILVISVVDSCGGFGHNFGPCYYTNESYSLPHRFEVESMNFTPNIGLIHQSYNLQSDTEGAFISQSIQLLSYHVQ